MLTDLISSPRVVATVHTPNDLRAVAEDRIASDTCDILEFRLDSLREQGEAIEAALSRTQLPCLLTARHPLEGGDGALEVNARSALLERFLPHATLIDLEARSLSEMGDLLEKAKSSGIGIIASAHDFSGPMSPELRNQVLETSRHYDADVTKMAMQLPEIAGLNELLTLAREASTNGQPIALMGMGPLGKVSRLALAAAGSCLNYGYLQEANAPGQWPAAELKRLIAEFSPGA